MKQQRKPKTTATSPSKKVATVKPKIDWEKLARNLQAALASEMKETQRLEKDVERLEIELVQASGIIKYLEMRRGNDSI